jgi:phage protein D
VLFFGKRPQDATIYELEWGRSLVSFMPSVKTKGQITRVVVRGWKPGGKGDDRKLAGTATFQDAGLELPDKKLVQAIDSALKQFEEQVVEDPVENQAEADAKAKGLLTRKLQDLITATGTTVGTPRLRAGKTIAVKGVGARYSGTYVLTETTHKVSNSGYTTDFKARMEGGPP